MQPSVIFVIGVSGVGKSTIGKLLSEELKISFFDGDDFHPESNVQKMSNGIALVDEDRYSWLQNLNELAKTQVKNLKSCVIVCSALKQSYRDILENTIEKNSKWIFLKGSFELIKERLDNRKGHFMGSKLLESQFNILEEPKNALHIDVKSTQKDIVKSIKENLENKSEFGLFGLGVMGKSLSRNLANNGFKMSLFNRHVDNLEVDVAKNFKNQFTELSEAQPFDDLGAFVNSLQKPRKIMLMVNAGKTTDYVINDLIPYLSKGDILIDGGNSNYKKTLERFTYLKSKNIQFIGTGVSGGEEGALKGPSIMPGGDKDSYNKIKDYLEAIAAKDKNGKACCTFIGTEGSGHFVKMVHNGIEYVEMQLLAEAYILLKNSGKNPDEIADVLETWKITTNSYLLEITIDILRKKENNDWLIHKIMDKAGNKGTGNWTTIATAELGIPSSMITTALFARYSSFFKDERIAASKSFNTIKFDVSSFNADDIHKAYQFARIVNHYQGFKLINEASKKHSWSLNLSELARIWTNGCIIRSDLMENLVEEFKTTDNLLSSKKLIEELNVLKPSIKKVVAESIIKEQPIPALTDAISFLNSFSKADSTANIIQAQRDYFGAHTYQRNDDVSGKFYHTNWQE
ncbi:phosphogluconate dehydrogenase (NADP(+)-dependent, decarboxylating) [Polaribacter reichenbachii]|uniref:6-phosphogluconate dehydrogenase, decarboxylating n=1 Tax=Polaribacter reichenbachii TaxID=996801 RepID=A0A1B8U066_9FLAO|nr:NADP-dependent phosphogluconate dehydrogenase [Polaribacter reichenbachii]APZ47086.1 phosphogluconate dehydrogenase (NADP(+)-dependent, decarboxylating) [Polaribacter reichenbachii]AUC17727.1 phosphogluconate dehydrogenase (NADP(+)-dependent, decarboxylating) [Polaribacter reichenbachii]OBY65250.1 phosphogluconate dehydrogenase (NADP(+)-dependent, decarboxylating) [Polaribacter reichenbachii]